MLMGGDNKSLSPWIITLIIVSIIIVLGIVGIIVYFEVFDRNPSTLPTSTISTGTNLPIDDPVPVINQPMPIYSEQESNPEYEEINSGSEEINSGNDNIRDPLEGPVYFLGNCKPKNKSDRSCDNLIFGKQCKLPWNAYYKIRCTDPNNHTKVSNFSNEYGPISYGTYQAPLVRFDVATPCGDNVVQVFRKRGINGKYKQIFPSDPMNSSQKYIGDDTNAFYDDYKNDQDCVISKSKSS
jgi:hypothetical protein